MLLYEVGYDQKIHDKEVKEIRDLKLESISDIIKCLRLAYYKMYKVKPIDINDGMCDDFAVDICDIIKGAKRHWDDEKDPELFGGIHCFIEYKSYFYDAECPQGVNHWLNLPYYKRYLEDMDHGPNY
jgi:hypothetical protein